MEKESLKYQRLREEMVRQQIAARGISDPAVLEAMRKIPRHVFVSEALRDQAYGDFPLRIGEQQTISNGSLTRPGCYSAARGRATLTH